MGTTTPGSNNETQVKCHGCGKTYNPSCDWRQGRCPLHPDLLSDIIIFFKQLFKSKK
jgi:hypothetical protein